MLVDDWESAETAEKKIAILQQKIAQAEELKAKFDEGTQEVEKLKAFKQGDETIVAYAERDSYMSSMVEMRIARYYEIIEEIRTQEG